MSNISYNSQTHACPRVHLLRPFLAPSIIPSCHEYQHYYPLPGLFLKDLAGKHFGVIRGGIVLILSYLSYICRFLSGHNPKSVSKHIMKRSLYLIVQAIAWSNALQQIPLQLETDGPSDMMIPSSSSSSSSSLPGKIPGGSPLRFCDESRNTDLYAIDNIELYPKPLHM